MNRWLGGLGINRSKTAFSAGFYCKDSQKLHTIFAGYLTEIYY